MRLLLQFIFFCFTISSIDAKCNTPQCHTGMIYAKNGERFTPDTEQTSDAEDGCVLLIEPNCDVYSRLRTGEYQVDYGMCKNLTLHGTVCAQASEANDDYMDPHYDLAVFNNLIRESGLYHCERGTFGSLRKEFERIKRKECTTRTQFILIICAIVGGIILGILLTVLLVILAICRKRKEYRDREFERNQEIMRIKRDQDAMEVARNPLDFYDDPNGVPMLNNFRRGPPTLGQRARQANAPYVDPRMNGMPMNPYCDPNGPPMMY